jgi:cell division septal protein FtsQ
MAVENRYPLEKPLITSFPLDSSIFHRPAKSLRLKTKPARRSLRLKHLLLLFFILVAFFFGLAELYYFLITCDRFNIKQVEVNSSSPEIQQAVESFLSSRQLGNILICDLSYLRVSLTDLPGVKDVRLEKVLPSTLKVEVFPRKPKVYVHRGSFYLVDEEGQAIANFASPSEDSFPVVEDEDVFRQAYQQKIQSACNSLDSLQPEVRALVRKIIFKKNSSMEIELTDDSTRIFIEGTGFSEKLNYYLINKSSWEERFGQLEYVDLRIEDRAYIKPVAQAEIQPFAGKKEVK